MFQTARGTSMCKGPKMSINLMCVHDLGIKSQELDRVGEARKPDCGKEFGRHQESGNTLQHHGEWTVERPRVEARRLGQGGVEVMQVMAEPREVAAELGKVVGFEVNFEGRTGLDLDSL